MSYELILKQSAEKEIGRLSKSVQRRVVDKMAQIATAPRGTGIIKLEGGKSAYRARVGDWRIVYEIDDDRRTVYVTIVAHRREVYR